LLIVPVPKTWPGRIFSDEVILIVSRKKLDTVHQCPTQQYPLFRVTAHTGMMHDAMLARGGGSADSKVKTGGVDKGV
jgi:hypothetical protein